MLARIYRAWTVAGTNPRYHRAMQRRVRSEMPVLAAALDDMTATMGRELEGMR